MLKSQVHKCGNEKYQGDINTAETAYSKGCVTAYSKGCVPKVSHVLTVANSYRFSTYRISVVQRAGGGMLDLKRTASNKWR